LIRDNYIKLIEQILCEMEDEHHRYNQERSFYIDKIREKESIAIEMQLTIQRLEELVEEERRYST